MASAQWRALPQSANSSFYAGNTYYIGNSSYQAFGRRVLALDDYAGPCYSDDGGTTWVGSKNGPQTNSVRSLVKKDNLAFLANYRSIYASSDTGRTWVTYGSSLESNVESIAFTRRRMVALTFTYPSEMRVYTSDDQAKSWQQSTSFSQTHGSASLTPFVPFTVTTVGDTVYVGSGAGLYVSKDAGQTWSVSFKQPIYFISPTDTEVFIGSESSTYMSYNAGSNWQEAVKTYQTHTLFRQNNIYVLGGNAGRVYSSLDRGRTWREFGQGLPTNYQSAASSFFVWNDSLRLGGYQYGRILWTRAIAETDSNYLNAPTLLRPVSGSGPDYQDRVNLSWVDNSTNETGFYVERSEDEQKTFRVIATLPVNSTTYLDKTLQVGINYYYRVRAFNTSLSSRPSNSAWFVKPVVCQTINWLSESLRGVTFVTDQLGFAIGDFRTLLKTADGGNTWRQLTHPAKGDLRTVQFINEQVGFVGGTQGLLRTVDGGTTWTLYRLPDTWDRGIGQFYFSDANRGFATEYQDGYGFVYQTINGGRTWTTLTDAQNGRRRETINSMVFSDSLTGYLAGNNGVLIKTSDGGKTWKDLNATSDVSSASFSKVFFLDKLRGYVFTTTQVWRTENGGTTWQKFTLPVNGSVNDVWFFNGSEGVMVTTTNAQRVAFYRTTNAGETWLPVVTTIEGFSTLNWLGLYGVGRKLWAVGNYDGYRRNICRSNDAGLTWETVTGDEGSGSIVSLSFRTRQEGVMLREGTFATQTNLYLYTSDGGETWHPGTLPGASGGAKAAVHFFNEQVGVIVAESAVWRTSDGGQSWQRFATNRPFKWFVGYGDIVSRDYIEFRSPTEWFAKAFSSDVYRTTNGGLTWAQIPAKPSPTSEGPNFGDASFGSALNGVKPDLSYTTDGGKTWKPGKAYTWDTFPQSVLMINSQVAYASLRNMGGFSTLKSTDGGANWFPIAVDGSNTPVGGRMLNFFDAETIYLTTYSSRLIRLSPGTAPAAEMYLQGRTTICMNDSATYTATYELGRSYRWSIPDGTGRVRSDQDKVTVQWTKPGRYKLQLIVADGCGNSAPSDLEVTVRPSPGKPVITVKDTLLISSFPGKNDWYMDGSYVYGYSGSSLPVRRNKKVQEGSYYVVISDSSGCSTRSESLRFIITGVEPISPLMANIQVYPNPAQDVVQVKLEAMLTGEATVELVDMQGVTIHTQTFRQSVPISLRGLPTGLYLLRVHTKHGDATYRLLIQP